MTSKKYWKTRSILLEQLLHDRSEVTAQRISRLYGLAQERIFQRIEKIFSNYVKGGTLTEAEAMRLLTVKETEEVLTDLRQMYLTAEGPAKKDIWARLSAPAYANRISRLQALRDRIYLQARMMGLEEVSYVRDRLSDTLEQSYYRTTFDIQHFTGEYYDFDRLTDRQIKAALATDWNGKNWSERIWDNNQMFADAVEDTVTVGIMTGQRYDEMRDNLLHVIGLDDTEGARYRSARLVQTECAYVANQGHLMGYQAAEIEKYIFLATLDLRTSKICRSLDGKRFLVSEAQPGTNYPPMHPWCRSTTMPDMTAEQLRKVPRAARDPKTGKSITVPGDMTYQQWYEKFVEGQGSKSLVKSGESGILNKKDIDAIKRYMSSDSYSLNAALRNPRGRLTAQQEKLVESIDGALKKLPDFTGRVYRSISTDMVNRDEFMAQYVVGKPTLHPAYTSTGKTVYDESMEIQMVIDVKHGKDISEWNRSEQEVLLGRGTYLVPTRIDGNTINLEEWP